MRISSIRWGVIWIGIGLFFLAINLEMLDSLVFPRLFSLWPVLLIAIGVELMFRRTKLYFLALLSPLIIAGAFMAAATAQGDWGWKADEFWRNWTWRTSEKKVDVAEISSDSTIKYLDINLKCGSSQVTLMPSSNLLFKATTEYHKRSPWIEHSVANGVGKIEFINREKTRLAILGLKIAASKSEFQIADYLPLRISLGGIDDEPDLDFRGLMVRSLNLDIRANRTAVHLGNSSDTIDVAISGRTDDLRVIVSQGFGVSVIGDSTRLEKLLYNSGLTRAGYGRYAYIGSPGRIVRLTLEANIRNLSIVRD